MKIILILALIVAVCIAARVQPAHNHNIIRQVNSNIDSTWIAGVSERFEGRTVDDVKRILGSPLSRDRKGLRVEGVPTLSYPPQANPDEFNSITQWPNCPTIGAIRNQAECGACWAFGCVEAVTDRFCIHSNASYFTNANDSLSFEQMVACGPDDGCEGGEPIDAWKYAKSYGLVPQGCSPWTVPSCAPDQEPCLPPFKPTPRCSKTCADGDDWDTQLHYMQSAYSFSGVNSMQTEMMTNGPIEVAFDVYEDFVSYKSGVYEHTHGELLGGHAVKMVGWGSLNGTDYWLCANSWTTTWGDNGFFMIKRGVNECGIEQGAVGGLPDYSKNQAKAC